MVPVGKVTYNNGGLALGSLWFASKIHLQSLIKIYQILNPIFFWKPMTIHVGIFTYIHHKNQPNVGKYIIHGSYGIFVFVVVCLETKSDLKQMVGNHRFHPFNKLIGFVLVPGKSKEKTQKRHPSWRKNI